MKKLAKEAKKERLRVAEEGEYSSEEEEEIGIEGEVPGDAPQAVVGDDDKLKIPTDAADGESTGVIL